MCTMILKTYNKSVINHWHQLLQFIKYGDFTFTSTIGPGDYIIFRIYNQDDNLNKSQKLNNV